MSPSEEVAMEDAVISDIKAGLERYAADMLSKKGRASWPNNPFDALETKPKGYLILSVPTASAFIYKSCEELEKGYVRIKNDYFGVRNGQVMRRFEDKDDFLSCFSKF